MQRNPIPMEWYIATLAALSVPLSVYTNLPMWTTYITWAGAFLVGPNEGIKKLYPTLFVGTVSGVVFFILAFTLDPMLGSVALVNSALVFSMTLGLLYLARVPMFALVPGIFFGFAGFVGMVLSAHVTTIGGLFAPWLYATAAMLLGPPLAWLSVYPYVPVEMQQARAHVAVAPEKATVTS